MVDRSITSAIPAVVPRRTAANTALAIFIEAPL
jgi:hypothetical protein